MDQARERRKPGTRPKGPRKAITVRVPDDQWGLFNDARAAAGYASLSDYVAALLAELHGLPVPSYARRADQPPLLRLDPKQLLSPTQLPRAS